MRFDAVAFDLDGTLYASPGLYAKAFLGMLNKTRSFLAFSAARRKMRVLGGDEAYRKTARADGPSFRAKEAELVAASLRISPEEAAILIERDFVHGIEELFAKVKPYKGVLPALDSLASAGLRLALLSDLPPARKLELLGLSGRFEPALCSEDSGFLKPAPEPFAMLASRLALPPERILYVGNSPSIDVMGASGFGMATAIVSRRPRPQAGLSFFDWGELVSFALN
jgi:putative hydrolase of the HAD superfamily